MDERTSHWPNLNVLLTRQPRLPVRRIALTLRRILAVSNCWRRYVPLCVTPRVYVGGRIQLIFEYPGLQLAKLEGKNGEQFTLERP